MDYRPLEGGRSTSALLILKITLGLGLRVDLEGGRR